MPQIINLAVVGSTIVARYDDDTSQFFFQAGPYWLPGGVPDDGNGSQTGDNGGDGDTEDDDNDAGTASLYNPWKSMAVSNGGTWDDHINRTGRGGVDYPYGGGTPIKAPAAGTLHISGGSGEYAAGTVGDAGKRSILYLDKTYARKKPRGRNEATGPMRAIVFQHQSSFKPAGHYSRGDVVGYTGNTGNGVYHLHVHGLDRGGSRVDFLKFF